MNGTVEIRRIPLWSVAKVVFLVMLMIGIIIAVFYSMIISGVGFLAGTFSDSPFGRDMLVLQRLGLVMIPIIAIFYAVFGTIAALIWVLLYNVTSPIVGGFEITLREKRGEPALEAPAPRPAETHVPERPIDGF